MIYIYLPTLTHCVILESRNDLVKISLGGQEKMVRWSDLAVLSREVLNVRYKIG